MLQLDTERKISILDALNIRYALLAYEHGVVLLITPAAVTRQLNTFREEGASADEVGALETAIASIGLTPDWATVRKIVQDFALEDVLWETNFTQCDCDRQNVHGYMGNNENGILIRQPVRSLFDGFLQVHALLERRMFDTNTGIHLLKQVVEIVAQDETIE